MTFHAIQLDVRHVHLCFCCVFFFARLVFMQIDVKLNATNNTCIVCWCSMHVCAMNNAKSIFNIIMSDPLLANAPGGEI